jgi:hypothetical protein
MMRTDKPCAGSSKRRGQVAAPKSTVKKADILALVVSDEREETLAAGLKHE